jgi:hypothetical protein
MGMKLYFLMLLIGTIMAFSGLSGRGKLPRRGRS